MVATSLALSQRAFFHGSSFSGRKSVNSGSFFGNASKIK